MLKSGSKRLAAVVAMLAARRGHAFVVPPRPTAFAASALCSTTNNEVALMRAGEIKRELESYGISTKSFLEKSELVDALVKARAEGLTPIATASSSTSSQSTTSTASTSASSPSASREERLNDELEKCMAMKSSELKQELEAIGISTKTFFEKSEFAMALAEARVDGVENQSGEGYAEYKNVEVLTDKDAGPRPKSQKQKSQQRSQSPFGRSGSQAGGDDVNDFIVGGMDTGGFGGSGGGSPFGGRGTSDGGENNDFTAGIGGMDMGGFGGRMGRGMSGMDMGGISDMLKNMGGGGNAAPFGGMGDALGKAQELARNPKVREIMSKAQSNPKVMAAVQECMSNPAAFVKYQNDPEVGGLINELRKYI